MKTSEIKENASLFIQLVIAAVKGDDAAAVGIKIQKTAMAQIRAQVAAKNAHTLTLEDNLEVAKEALAQARINNGLLISDSVAYIKTLLIANRKISQAEDEIKNHEEEITFLTEQLSLISK
jgi:hypothetical protein